MDDPSKQQRLVELLLHGNVRTVHPQEASLKELFIEIAGFGLPTSKYYRLNTTSWNANVILK
jgi:hypothetical protein